MNARERFNATMHYQERDRCPIMDFGFWRETLIEWEKQGLPSEIKPDDYFGMDPQWILAPVNVHLCPNFGHTVIEDRGETEIVIDGEGVTKEQGKYLGSIPRHLDHTLKDRKSWEEHFVPKLVGGTRDRFAENWDELVVQYKDPNRDYPLGLYAGSLYGWIRNWMGLEAVSMLVYDDLPLFEEMVETVANTILETMKVALDSGIKFEYGMMWEDMCYRAGPLLSPKIFKKVLVPHLKRISGLLLEYGVDVIIVDSDGDISQLLPFWLESGVKCMFPMEAGTWDADPVEFRRKYGKELLMVGGVSKTTLAKDKASIDAMIDHLTPLVEDGGFIPLPDHRVPPDVPLDNYLYYLNRIKQVWGKGLDNVRPTGVIANRKMATADADYSWHLGD